jgi:hypothetical protein
MPSSSIDTFLASSVMIVLALSGMVGTAKLMEPYLNDLANRDSTERFQYLASHLLRTTGTPANWGQLKGTKPTSLGLAEANALQPYELDIDKVSRLNSDSIYRLDYSDLWQMLGVKDVSFRIEVRTLFQLSIEPVSNSIRGSQTVYEFEVVSTRSGVPVAANLSSYVTVKDFVNGTTALTSSNGVGTFSLGIPNSINGTALLLVFAQSTANSQVVAFSTSTFGHNSPNPLPNSTFTRLSPLDYVLNVSLLSPSVEISRSQIFTFNYSFNLTATVQDTQTIEYAIPRLIDRSPVVLVLTGLNGSTSYAEWVTYPHVPLEVGANFTESTAGFKIAVQNHIVTIESALYEIVTMWGSLNEGV